MPASLCLSSCLRKAELFPRWDEVTFKCSNNLNLRHLDYWQRHTYRVVKNEHMHRLQTQMELSVLSGSINYYLVTLNTLLNVGKFLLSPS